MTLLHSDDTIDSDHPPRTQVTLINESHHNDEANKHTNASITLAAGEDGHNSVTTTATVAVANK